MEREKTPRLKTGFTVFDTINLWFLYFWNKFYIHSMICLISYIIHVSRKAWYEDVYRRTIEMLQRTRIFKANCCLKVQNAHFKLTLPISGHVTSFYGIASLSFLNILASIASQIIVVLVKRESSDVSVNWPQLRCNHP